MKKTIFLLCLLIFICGCKKAELPDTQNGKDVIVFPTEQVAETINGYKAESNSSSEESGSVLYIANTNSKKFHLADCTFATSMKEENKLHANSRNDLINNGYTPCKSCKP